MPDPQGLPRIHPEAGRALYAGELIEGLVPPNDLRFHIRDAVGVAGAQRIGHGVAITYETGSGEALRRMAGKPPVAVEINLVSNAQLLGVTGAEHPLPLYVERRVPMVLATDDPGIMHQPHRAVPAGPSRPGFRFSSSEGCVTSRRGIDRNGPRSYRSRTQSLMLFSSRSSGSWPFPRMRSWKARRSNLGPSSFCA